MATDAGQLTTPTGTTALAGERDTVVVQGLVRRFGERVILDHLDLRIPDGQFVALLGHSGSGKSTLLRALAGLDHRVDGSGTLRVPGQVSMIFQDARLLPWLRVLENVTLGLHGRGAAQRGRVALAEVGLAGREDAWPGQLSGGEAQRAALARSLVWQPQLLLADEPFGALDALTRIRMHRLLHELCQRHRPAVLLVTHDVDEAVLLADRVLVLTDGRVDVDTPINLTGVRSPRNPDFQRYRESLLTALGVPTDGADHGRS
jgi:sulfonate transport system ATP-binding protein